MNIKILKDVAKFVLTSTVKTADIELIKKHRPGELKIKDAEGNDVFGMSYVKDKHCISKNGVTFGGTSNEGEFAIVVGDLPATLPTGTATDADYVADLVGAALPYINALEAKLPEVAATIKAERAALIADIVTA